MSGGHLTAELPKTRCEPELKAAVENVARREQRDVAFVIRRYVREGVEREKGDKTK